MIGKQENDICYFCGSKLEHNLSIIPFIVNNRVVVIKQVPADVCTQCNEPIMNNEVAITVDGLLKQAYRTGFEVSVVNYQQPIPMVA